MAGNTNLAGLTKADYRGAPSTLCQGCGHNSMASQIVATLFEMDIVPENVVKFSGIGCSSKCPTYFLGRSFGFNGLHGRMPSAAQGALFADTTLKGLGMSGDGDSASIGMSQFKYVVRRNPNLVYIVANNGVYGLTKGQFSATAEKDLELKRQGVNPYPPIDVCIEALVTGATFVARTFAGDPKQVKALLKAAFSHRGTAVLDLISPCVTFNNEDTSFHSYGWAKDHQMVLNDISYVPKTQEIMLELEIKEGEVREVKLHDGSMIVLKKLEKDYDPTNKARALQILTEAAEKNWLLTGLFYVDANRPTLTDIYDLPEDIPLNRLPESRIRPAPETIKMVNELMF